MRRPYLLLLALFGSSCTGPTDDTSPRRPQAQGPSNFVANGSIGIQLGADGTTGGGLQSLFALNVEADGEERLLPVSGVWDAVLNDGIKPVSTSQDTDFQTGVLTTTSSYPGGVQSKLRIVASLVRPEIVEVREVKGRASLHVPVPASATHTRSGFVLQLKAATAEVRLDGKNVKRNESGYEVLPDEDGVVRLVRSISVGSRPRPFEEIVIENQSHLAGPTAPRIEIEGPPDDQRFVDSVMFRLRSALNTREPNLGPFGLTGNQYHGHVFWDADMWVFPALALLDPSAARKIPEYRSGKVTAAQMNFQEWCGAGRPVGDKRKLGAYPPTSLGLKFPWESSASGRETMPGPSNLSSHITPTIAYSLNLAAVLGLASDRVADQVLAGADAFIEARSERKSKGLLEIRSTYTADEQLQDNDLYTNLVSQWVLNGGTWARKRRSMKLPGTGDLLKAFEGDTGKSYKQASAVLSVFPLQYPDAETKADALLSHYKPKTFQFGPAMSGSIHATILARAGYADDAYETWKSDWHRHTIGRDLLFVEKERTRTPYFLTGAAGALQTVLYGFAGIRVAEGAPIEGAPSLQLRRGWHLSVHPTLPSRWRSLTIRNLVVLGRRYDLTCRDGRANLRPAP